MTATLKTTIIQEPSSATANMTLGTTGGVTFGAAATTNTITSAAATNLTIQSAGTTAMTIDTSQNVGIGTSSPSKKLEVYAASNSLQILSVVRNDNTGTGVAAIGFNTSSSPSSEATSTKAGIGLIRGFAFGGGALAFYNNNSGAAGDFTTADEKMRIDASGNLLVGYTSSNGSYKLQVNSQIFATSSTIATSDANYKTNVMPLSGALDIVQKLNPVSFSWKEHAVHNFDTATPTVGFLAQEVQTALSGQTYVNSIVKESEVTLPDETKEKFLGIAEGNMIALLTKAIQEQQATITTLTARIATLEAK